jgi:hypothetical protein
LQRLLERDCNHCARNIGGFLCAPNLYNACWRCSCYEENPKKIGPKP